MKGSKCSLMFSRAEAKCLKVNKLWRRRVGVEPTIRSAKGRIGGFEGRDSHRTIFASAWIIDHHDWASDLLPDVFVDLLALIRSIGTTFRACENSFAAGRAAHCIYLWTLVECASNTLQL